MTRTYGPSDIETASDGDVSQADLRNWWRARLFTTPLAEPRAGHPREFSLRAVHEALLLRKLSDAGVPLTKASQWARLALEKMEADGVPKIDDRRGQYGSGVEVMLFDPNGDAPEFLGVIECGQTINKLFRILTKGNGPAESLGAIHLPAVITKINRALGVE